MRITVISSFSHSILFNELYEKYVNAHYSLRVQGKSLFYLNCLPLIFDYFNNTFVPSVFLWFH